MTTFRLGPWNTIAEGIFVLVAQPANVNIGLVVGQDSCLLIDTGSTPDQGREIRARIAEVTDRPLTHVVVTHAHWDHLYGLAAFDDLVTIGHESIATSFNEDADTARQCAELGISPTDLSLPTNTFVALRAVGLGGRAAQIVHVGPGHTPSDTIVIADKVVFTGDLVETEPSIEDEGTLTAWPMALDNVMKSSPKDSIFIPGHGDPVDQTGVTRQRGELAWIAGQVEESISRGVSLASALEALGTEGAPDWPYSDEYMRGALPIAYGQLARVGHTPRRQLPITSI